MTLGNLLKKMVQNIDAKLNKSGDTMTGDLNIGSGNSGDKYIYFHNANRKIMIGLTSGGGFRIRDETTAGSEYYILNSSTGLPHLYGASDNGFRELTEVVKNNGTKQITLDPNSFYMVLVQRKTNSTNTSGLISLASDGSNVYHNIMGTAPDKVTISKSGLTITLTNTSTATSFWCSILKVH